MHDGAATGLRPKEARRAPQGDEERHVGGERLSLGNDLHLQIIIIGSKASSHK